MEKIVVTVYIFKKQVCVNTKFSWQAWYTPQISYAFYIDFVDFVHNLKSKIDHIMFVWLKWFTFFFFERMADLDIVLSFFHLCINSPIIEKPVPFENINWEPSGHRPSWVSPCYPWVGIPWSDKNLSIFLFGHFHLPSFQSLYHKQAQGNPVFPV